MTEKLEGKTAIVTGGAMGIGFGIAKSLAEAGANILLTDLDGEKASVAARRLEKAPGRVVATQTDVASGDAGERLVAKCTEVFDTPEILVNNAGIFPMVPVLEMTQEFFDRVIQVNLKGLVFISQTVAKAMIQKFIKGKIINIASIDAFHPSMVGLAAYDASKAGVVMFTKSFALELGHYGITVNAIAPGGIRTEGTNTIGGDPETQKTIAAFETRIPLQRMGVPDDIAKVVKFLASSGSDYITGETIIVDGGVLLA